MYQTGNTTQLWDEKSYFIIACSYWLCYFLPWKKQLWKEALALQNSFQEVLYPCPLKTFGECVFVYIYMGGWGDTLLISPGHELLNQWQAYIGLSV